MMEDTYIHTTEWLDGHYKGGIKQIKSSSWEVSFFKGSPKYPTEYKYFAFSNYDSKEKALEVVEEYRRKISDEKGLTKNKYRVVIDSNGVQYVEMQLDKNKILCIDLTSLEEVRKHVWHAFTSKYNSNWYARTKLSNRKRIFVHTLLTGFSMVDHKNRDGLDNRLANLRETSSIENARNHRKYKNNKSGVSGVTRTIKKPNRMFWNAHWRDNNGKKCNRWFSVRLYGEEEAKRLAIQARKEGLKTQFIPTIE